MKSLILFLLIPVMVYSQENRSEDLELVIDSSQSQKTILSDSSKKSLSPIETVNSSKTDKCLQSAKFANSMCRFGQILAWGGLGLDVVGTIFSDGGKYVTVPAIGAILIYSGIPIIGIGASISNNAAKKMNTNYIDAGSGWFDFSAGWVSQLVGVFLIVNEVNNSKLTGSFTFGKILLDGVLIYQGRRLYFVPGMNFLIAIKWPRCT